MKWTVLIPVLCSLACADLANATTCGEELRKLLLHEQSLDVLRAADGTALRKMGFVEFPVEYGPFNGFKKDKPLFSLTVVEYEENGILHRKAGWLAGHYGSNMTGLGILLYGPDLEKSVIHQALFDRRLNPNPKGAQIKHIFVKSSGLGKEVFQASAIRLIDSGASVLVRLTYKHPTTGVEYPIIGKLLTEGNDTYKVISSNGVSYHLNRGALFDPSIKLSAFPIRSETPPILPELPPAPERAFRGTVPGSTIAPYIETGSQIEQKIHEEITRDLFTGEILEPARIAKLVYRVKLKVIDPQTGKERHRDAIFKARIWGDKRSVGAAQDGFGRTPLEYVAYFLNRRFKMDIVPPTAFRRGLQFQLDEGQTVTEGAVSYYVPNLKTQMHSKGASSDHVILNQILSNPDGNIFNYGEGEHWVDAKVHDVSFDFSASFSNMHGLGSSSGGTYETIRRPVYEALRTFRLEELRGFIHEGFISENEAHRIKDSVDSIVRKIDRLVEEAKEDGLPESLVILSE